MSEISHESTKYRTFTNQIFRNSGHLSFQNTTGLVRNITFYKQQLNINTGTFIYLNSFLIQISHLITKIVHSYIKSKYTEILSNCSSEISQVWTEISLYLNIKSLLRYVIFLDRNIPIFFAACFPKNISHIQSISQQFCLTTF